MTSYHLIVPCKPSLGARKHLQHTSNVSVLCAGNISAEAGASEEGLSAYAMDTVPEDLLHQAAASSSSNTVPSELPAVALANADPAVLELLQGLEKLVVGRHLPRLQKWLKVFVKVREVLPAVLRKLVVGRHLLPRLQK